MPPNTIIFVDREGNPHEVAPDGVAAAVNAGWHVQTDQDVRDRAAAAAREKDYGGIGSQVIASGAAALRGATAGLSDAAITAIGGGAAAENLRNLREENPALSTGFEIAGAVAPTLLSGGAGAAGAVARATPTGIASRVGADLARTAEGAGVLARAGRAGLGGAVEGAILGAGTGVSELALSQDPLDFETAASVLSSRALFGAGVGAAAASAAKLAEIGLGKARAALEDVAAAKPPAAGEVAEDLAGMDVKQLAAAERAELEALKSARVPMRKQLVDELDAFTREVKEAKHHLTTGGLKLPAAEGKLATTEISKISLDANRALNRVIRNPTDLADNLKPALSALRQQEYGFTKLLERADDLKLAYAADTSGTRLAALESIPKALEKNRALQARITELTAAPSSQRLTAIADAKLAAQVPAPPRSFGEQLAGGVVFGKVASLASGIPFVGGILGPILGAKASTLVGEKVFGRMGKAIGEARARSAKAVAGFFAKAEKGTRAAPVLATRVLAGVRFAPESAPEPERPAGEKPKARDELPRLFRQRSAELRSQMTTGPDGRAVMRPEARAELAERLRPIAAMNPHLADRIETIAARRAEFLFERMPRRPAIAGIPTGPDIWEPSRMQLAKWARYVAAVEDPNGIVERLVDGSVTTEDAEVMREVYPETYAAIQRQMLEQLPTLRERLPYHRRLAWSLFSGVPVDAALDPGVLDVLQGVFAAEPGTDGGIRPPMPQPQFGSVRAERATPAQIRSQGVTTR